MAAPSGGFTPRTSFDSPRKEAKRWLKALRAGDRDARVRLARAYANAPADPTLRDVQHALAREQGHESWNAMKAALTVRESEREARDRVHATRVAAFLMAACPDAPVRGPNSREVEQSAAMRILTRHPEVARDSIYTAVACGDRQEVGRILMEHPDAPSP